MSPTNAALKQHVRDLCRAFNVELVVKKKMAPHEAHTGRIRLPMGVVDFICIAPVTEEATYAVALHELGHRLSPLGSMKTHQGSLAFRQTGRFSTRRDVLLEVEEETAAWEWAEHYALEWTPVMDYVKNISLGSYRAVAQRIIGRLP